jgi:putative hydrolase of the HAD superfamily
MRRDIEAVAFDLDGTLYPNYRLNVRLVPFLIREWPLVWAFGKARSIIRAAQSEAALVVPGRGQIKSALPASVTNLYDWQAQLAAQQLGAEPAAVKEKIDSLIYRGWESHFKRIALFPRVRETLAALRHAGFRLALLSDFPPEQKLENLGLADCWDAVLCSERSGALKPHPLPFRDLAEALRLPPEKILYTGNSYRYDVLGAHRAGMQTAWIASPLARLRRRIPPPLFTFHDYRQLLHFML